MAQLSGTKTAKGSDPKLDPKDDNKLTKDDVRNEPKVENSTEEFLGINQRNRGEYDKEDEQTQFDPIAAENARHSTEVGHAAYSADPPKKDDEHKASKGGGWKGKDSEKKGGLMTVKLLKDYGPASPAVHEFVNEQDNVYTIAGKVPAGTHIRLPKDEALRFIKLGSAEAAEDQK